MPPAASASLSRVTETNTMGALVPSPAVSPAHMMAAVGDLLIKKEEHDSVVTCDGSYPIPGTAAWFRLQQAL
jgi:hypothetical protein